VDLFEEFKKKFKIFFKKKSPHRNILKKSGDHLWEDLAQSSYKLETKYKSLILNPIFLATQ